MWIPADILLDQRNTTPEMQPHTSAGTKQLAEVPLDMKPHLIVTWIIIMILYLIHLTLMYVYFIELLTI